MKSITSFLITITILVVAFSVYKRFFDPNIDNGSAIHEVKNISKDVISFGQDLIDSVGIDAKIFSDSTEIVEFNSDLENKDYYQDYIEYEPSTRFPTYTNFPKIDSLDLILDKYNNLNSILEEE